jgi:hypothetical protein
VFVAVVFYSSGAAHPFGPWSWSSSVILFLFIHHFTPLNCSRLTIALLAIFQYRCSLESAVLEVPLIVLPLLCVSVEF